MAETPNKLDGVIYELIVKNLPSNITNLEEAFATLQSTPQQVQFIGRRRALLSYDNETAAKAAMAQLQNQGMQDKKLQIILHGPKRKGYAHKCIQTPENFAKSVRTTQNQTKCEMPKICEFVRKLYACDAGLDFEQPPAPYLRYAYPRITPDILDAISIALMSNSRFYTQVLHLMNRMNLEPPFGPRTGPPAAATWPTTASTQTEEAIITTRATQKSSESELESSDNEEQRKTRKPAEASLKRKQPPNEEQYKKKARRLLQSTLHTQKQQQQQQQQQQVPSKISTPATSEVFEESVALKSTKIALQLTPKERKSSEKQIPLPVAVTEPTLPLETRQLTADERAELPVFKNYQMGVASHKLYIKNLAKDVTEQHLLELYARYVDVTQLEVKVMQQGRMKGQAFVSFSNLEGDAGVETVARALSETNGLMLLQKPMVVCYGKQ